MTAIARRRTRRTVAAATLAVGLVLAAAAMFTIGVVTLSNSQEGEAVGIDDRPRVELPATPNALLAITDDDGELASVVVSTLLPEGQGGSIVTIPVNADTSAGFGLQRRPLDSVFDVDDLQGLRDDVEAMLSVSIERIAIVDPERLEELLAPIESVQVVLPDAVIDTSEIEGPRPADTGSIPPGETVPADPEPGLIIGAGPQVLGPAEVVDVLTAIDEEVPAAVQHDIDVAMWSAVAQTAPISVPPEPVTTDDVGRPVAPDTVADLFASLWQGDVGVRDIDAADPIEDTNPTDVDVVVLDRFDANLVFAQVSPGLVSTPNTGLKTRIVAQFSDEQLEASDGRFDSNSDLARALIGEVLFLQGNVVSVDTSASGAPDVTVIEVAEERSLADAELIAELLFGPAEVRVATTVLEGVDVQVTLGLTYFERRVDEAAESDTTVSSGTVESDG